MKRRRDEAAAKGGEGRQKLGFEYDLLWPQALRELVRPQASRT